MILSNWTQLRVHFADTGATTVADGLPEWPGPLLDGGTGAIDNTGAASLLRVNGFTGTLRATTAGGYAFPLTTIGPLVDPTKIPALDACWPLVITCNGGAVDAVTGVHDFDAFVSQRRDPGMWPIAGSATPVEFPASSQPFAVAIAAANKSGSITLTPNTAAVAALLPGLSGSGLLTSAAFSTLFRHVHVYFRRRADHAIQWARLYED
jgi:hypothetical protein